MSRVGNRIILIPKNVETKIEGTSFQVKGPLGELKKDFSSLIAIEENNQQITTVRANEEKHTKQLHGTTNALIANMIEGVTKGFQKELLITGVGYKALLEKTQLVIHAGYSHTNTLDIPKGLKVEITKLTQVKISGIEKDQVGQFAAVIRSIRKPNPYSGKGILYKGEKIKIKEGKAAGK